jgi:hypothetical protein
MQVGTKKVQLATRTDCADPRRGYAIRTRFLVAPFPMRRKSASVTLPMSGCPLPCALSSWPPTNLFCRSSLTVRRDLCQPPPLLAVFPFMLDVSNVFVAQFSVLLPRSIKDTRSWLAMRSAGPGHTRRRAPTRQLFTPSRSIPCLRVQRTRALWGSPSSGATGSRLCFATPASFSRAANRWETSPSLATTPCRSTT